METKQRIRAFLNKYLSDTSIGEDENIFEIGLVNSLFAMQLVSFLEGEFDIAISNDELDIDNFKSINVIAAFVDAKTSV